MKLLYFHGMGQWDNYFVANAGAAAALTGLIFVAVSINLQRILSNIHLPNRALGSLTLLVNILIVASLCLVPDQPTIWLGSEILVLATALWVIFSFRGVATYRHAEKEYKGYILQSLLFSQLAIIPFLVSGICMITGASTAGLYWLIPAFIFSYIKALTDAWVLLVEINR